MPENIRSEDNQMIGKQHFGQIINFLINIALGLVLTTVGLSMAGPIQPLVFIQSFVVSMAVGYTICDLIPAPAWGKMLTERLGIGNRLGCHLLSTAVGGLVLITCISFFCQFVAVGSNIMAVWPHALPYLLAAGYLVLIIFMPLCERIAGALTS